MKPINYDTGKRIIVLEDETRRIDLEVCKQMILNNQVKAVVAHKSRPNQRIFILDYEGYACAVPFVETEAEFFLKTAYHSREFEAFYFPHRQHDA